MIYALAKKCSILVSSSSSSSKLEAMPTGVLFSRLIIYKYFASWLPKSIFAAYSPKVMQLSARVLRSLVKSSHRGGPFGP
jgi:hypothetical protein